MTFDIIILSNAHNDKCLNITKKVIKNLREVEDIIKYNIIIVEQTARNYDVTTLHYDFPFNYNKLMNMAISQTKNKYVILCNNDLVFHKKWAENIYRAFSMGYKSLSPYCPNVTNLGKGDHLIEGYIIAVHICGWCICIDRDIISQIGGLNEDVEFWYSDNIYGEQIRRAGIKHALVCNAFVEHTCYGSNTLKSMPRAAQYDYTVKQLTSYNKALQSLYVETKENNN
ncbi:MAG: hypothetical protein NTZ85_01660 [Bacteroidia bacterium]|nr:hypothetical protein [Bacteroidia bacterium]